MLVVVEVVAGDGDGACIRGPPDQRVGKLATWRGAEFFFFYSATNGTQGRDACGEDLIFGFGALLL